MTATFSAPRTTSFLNAWRLPSSCRRSTATSAYRGHLLHRHLAGQAHRRGRALDKAENALKQALKNPLSGTPCRQEGAFYGLKVEYSLTNNAQHQVDFSMPGLLGAEYVAEDNTRRTPVMLHRAIVGSFERFIGILIEHYAGAFPVWLAPHQVVVMTITERQNDYARSIANRLANQGFRIISDLRNEKISYKIREHSLQKLPYHLVVGDKEMQAETVAVRTRSGEDLGAMTLGAFTERLQAEAKAQ
jgi:threonyl-tRNA synthetase